MLHNHNGQKQSQSSMPYTYSVLERYDAQELALGAEIQLVVALSAHGNSGIRLAGKVCWGHRWR
jgi:hypothetical protein